MRRTFFALAFSLTLAACASVPRTEAFALADTGARATTAFRGQLNELSTMVSRAGGVNVFLQTYEACSASSVPEACMPAEESEPLRTSRQRLVTAIALRQRAITELGEAYEALRAEANYDAAADLQGATSKLVSSASASLAFFQLSPSANVAAKAAIEIAPRAAGFFAAEAQTRRLRAGSARIGAAARMLAQALEAEKQVYVGFSQDFATRENAVRGAMFSSGAVPRQRALEPLAAAMGLPLSANVEATLGQNRALRTATEGYDSEQTRARVALYPSSYDTGHTALIALAAAHDRFEAKDTLDLAAVTQLIEELTAIITAIRVAQPAPAPSGN